MPTSVSSIPRSRKTVILIAAFACVPALLLTPLVARASSYQVHGPISIGYYDSFASIAAAQGWPGDGSQAHPYVISGYEISTSGAYGCAISIRYQSAWVVIRDNWIHNTGNGICLQFGLSGAVTNNLIENLVGAYPNGIYSGYDRNLNVTNNVIHNPGQSGVDSWDYGPTTLSGNTITGGTFGIIAWSDLQTVTRNTVSGSSLLGIYDYGGVGDVVTDNHVNGGSLACIASLSYQVQLLRNVLSGCGQVGIREFSGYHLGTTTIGENTISTSPVAIRVDDGKNVVVRGNVARDAGTLGILLDGSKPVTVVGNDLENHTTGILVTGGRDHAITQNVVKGGSDGIYFLGSNLNTISGNRVTGNARGLTLNASQGNLVYDNVFANARNALVVNGFDNEWSIPKTPGTNVVGGPNLGGNFWSDYTGVDADLDGLGDVTYGLLPGGTIPSIPPQAPAGIPAPPAPALPVTPPALPPLPTLPNLPALPVAPPPPPQPDTVYSQFFAYGPYDKLPLMTAPVAVSPPEVTTLVPHL